MALLDGEIVDGVSVKITQLIEHGRSGLDIKQYLSAFLLRHVSRSKPSLAVAVAHRPAVLVERFVRYFVDQGRSSLLVTVKFLTSLV